MYPYGPFGNRSLSNTNISQDNWLLQCPKPEIPNPSIHRMPILQLFFEDESYPTVLGFAVLGVEFIGLVVGFRVWWLWLWRGETPSPKLR